MTHDGSQQTLTLKALFTGMGSTVGVEKMAGVSGWGWEWIEFGLHFILKAYRWEWREVYRTHFCSGVWEQREHRCLLGLRLIFKSLTCSSKWAGISSDKRCVCARQSPGSSTQQSGQNANMAADASVKPCQMDRSGSFFKVTVSSWFYISFLATFKIIFGCFRS